MSPFFNSDYSALVEKPNGQFWWHNMPMPDGTRVNGIDPDKHLQLKFWESLQIPSEGGLNGKSVLDIGANDGFYSVAAHLAGASKVTSINSTDWHTWPLNIKYTSELWGAKPDVITADFRTHDFKQKFDVIFFFGVLYHLEDVFGCMSQLSDLLVDDGSIYMETQMTAVQSDLPIFEYASDIYPTIAAQHRSTLKGVGISNYLFPNDAAVRNLAHSYDLDAEPLLGRYPSDHPYRALYKLKKKPATS